MTPEKVGFEVEASGENSERKAADERFSGDIVPMLPCPHSEAWTPVAIPLQLHGAVIVAIGSFPGDVDGCEPRNGGLVIDYRPKDSPQTERVVFNFDETAMWIAFESTESRTD